MIIVKYIRFKKQQQLSKTSFSRQLQLVIFLSKVWLDILSITLRYKNKVLLN